MGRVQTWLSLTATALWLSCLPGCPQPIIHQSPWLLTQQDAATYVTEALEDPNGDVRRDALARLAASRFRDTPTTLDACEAIARTDRSDSVRTEAIRLLAESRRPQSAEVLVTLAEGEGPQPSVGDRVRVEALHGLTFLLRQKAVESDGEEKAAACVIELLGQKRSHDVWVAAARLLGEIPRRDAMEALVTALGHADFGVRMESERSLMRLTGVTHQHDADAWRQWLASVEDPFALRGRMDAALRGEDEKPWRERMNRSLRETMAGFQGKP